MKSNSKSRMSPTAATLVTSSTIFDFNTSLIKGRNTKVTPLKFQMTNPSLNKTSYSEYNPTKKRIPANVINNLINNKRAQMESNNNNNGNNGIDIKISVNYPQKDGNTPTADQSNALSKQGNSNHRRNTSANYYQNNLNISLTNYANQGVSHQLHNERGREVVELSNPSMHQYQSGDKGNDNIPVESQTQQEQGIEYGINKEFIDTETNTNTNTDANTKKNSHMTYFTTGNSDGNTHPVSLINNNTCLRRVLSNEPKAIDLIKTHLIEGLDQLHREVKDRDKEKIEYLNKKYQLYHEALIHFWPKSLNEEDNELVNLIANGINSLIGNYNENKEKMNQNYSDLFHRFVEIQKDNHEKNEKISQLEAHIEELKHNQNKNTRIQNKSKTHNNSQSHTRNNNFKEKQKTLNQALSDNNIHLLKNKDEDAYTYTYNPNLTQTNQPNTNHFDILKKAYTEGIITKYSSKSKDKDKEIMTDVNPFYLTHNNNNSINKNFKLQYNSNKETPKNSNSKSKYYVSKLYSPSPNSNTKQDSYYNTWKSNSTSKKQTQTSKAKVKGNNIDSYTKIQKQDYNASTTDYNLQLNKDSSMKNHLKSNFYIDQCQSFLNMKNINKIRKANLI